MHGALTPLTNNKSTICDVSCQWLDSKPDTRKVRCGPHTARGALLPSLCRPSTHPTVDSLTPSRHQRDPADVLCQQPVASPFQRELQRDDHCLTLNKQPKRPTKVPRRHPTLGGACRRKSAARPASTERHKSQKVEVRTTMAIPIGDQGRVGSNNMHVAKWETNS